MDAFNEVAVRKVFRIKKRDPRNPVLVLVAGVAAVPPLVNRISPVAEMLMARFWPGRLTLVFEASPAVSQDLTAATGRIGIRVVRHPVAAALVAALGRPITGTSANRSGFAPCDRVADLDPQVIQSVGLIFDAGPLFGSGPSTVVDVTGERPLILRIGAVSADEIHAAGGLNRS